MSTEDIAAPRPILPALRGLYSGLAPYSYSLMRFCTGAILVPHGCAKLFGQAGGGLAGMFVKWGLEPAIGWAYFIGCLEFFGGIMLALGLLTRPVALMIAVEMAVAAFGVHWSNGFFWGNHGYEFPLLWGLLCLAIAFGGGGRLSVDRLIGREF